jgi:hypothetical protein
LVSAYPGEGQQPRGNQPPDNAISRQGFGIAASEEQWCVNRIMDHLVKGAVAEP